ncbi:MAG: universal stress protein [Alphaproteobacteria bacterium]|nr:universal stress protein [Alphaproteobacteria bacterium]
MFQRILVPVDFSDASLQALRMAVALAREQGATVTALHVVASPAMITGELDMTPGDAAMWSDLDTRLRDSARQRLGELLEAELDADVVGQATVREGYAPAEILAEAKSGGHDLIVMGPHGRSGIVGALVGSVTRRVMGKCEVPLLLAR